MRVHSDLIGNIVVDFAQDTVDIPYVVLNSWRARL